MKPRLKVCTYAFSRVVLSLVLLSISLQFRGASGKVFFISSAEDGDDGHSQGSAGVAPVSAGEAKGPESDLQGVVEEDENFWPSKGPSSPVDPGAWRPVVEQKLGSVLERAREGDMEAMYIVGLKKLLGAPGFVRDIPRAVENLRAAADKGHSGAQSAMGLLHSCGYGVNQSDAKAFLYHSFAAQGGSFQSKMALGYSYLRQQEYELAVSFYAEVAAQSMLSFSIPGEAIVVETVPLMQRNGAEENTDAIRGHRGEDDEHIQYLIFTADKGSPESNLVLGNLHYWGTRGMPKDPVRAFVYIEKAAELGDASAMANLGEMYARGVGVEADNSKAMQWFEEAAKRGIFQAFNGIGYMYAKGKGVPKNYTKAYEKFNVAAANRDPEGLYNVGVMHMNGMGRKRSPATALKYFEQAQQSLHLGAIYQIAKMSHKGIGTKHSFLRAAMLYKAVAERGPWGSILRWAHESYIDGRIGVAALIYQRAAELGYEVAQSNAAWLLTRHHGDGVCYGATGKRCTEEEQNARAHTLWRHSSEQGNIQAALLIGDAYYYGRGTKKDLERAVKAYRRASAQKNPQAMYNLGYMHEHGLGLPRDLHLAKRHYDMALEQDSTAIIAVKIALLGLWLRSQEAAAPLMRFIDALPEEWPKAMHWLQEFMSDEGNSTVLTLTAILIAVLYLRSRRRAAAIAQPGPQEHDEVAPLDNVRAPPPVPGM